MKDTSVKHIIDMAAGREKADVVITNANIVDVFTGSVRKGCLAFGGGKVLGMGKAGEYEGKVVIDAEGRYLLPGLVDGHVHIESSMVSPAQFARAVMVYGTTAVIADPHEIANVRGLDGLRYMLDASSELPLTVRIMLPSCVPAVPFENAGAVLGPEDLATLIDHEGVGGIGEVMNFPGVVGADDDMTAKISLGVAHGKVVDGHSPTLEGVALNAYAASGISTDHECTTLEEMEDRLARGMYVLIREGSAAKNLEALIKGVTPANMRRCVFCTDDRQPEDIVREGHINNHLRKAVSLGLDAVSAVTMASLNAAECYGLKGKGALAPGYDADIVMVDDLTDFTVRKVFAAGKLVAEDGAMVCDMPETDASDVRDTVRIKPVAHDDLALKLECPRANVIGILPHSIVTEARVKDVLVDENGCFDAAQNDGLLKLAVVERHNATGNVGVGIIEGYGLKGGAVATTVAHDSHNIVVVGDNDADMLEAIRDLERIGGGITMCRGGKVVSNLPLPLAGLMSDKSAGEVGEQLKTMNEQALELFGISNDLEPFMTLSFMTLPVIPELKLTDNGLFDVRTFSFTPVCVSE